MPARWQPLDELRGASMLLLVLVGPLLLFPSTPAWLTHASGEGLYFADLGVPMFLFALGLSYPLSFERRVAAAGLIQTTLGFLRRYSLLLVLGLLGEAARYQDLSFSYWGMLELIGTAGIITFPLMFLGPGTRVGIGFLCLACWQQALAEEYRETVIAFDLGGPLAVSGWICIVLVGTAISQWRESISRKALYGLLACATVAGLLGAWGLGALIPIDKHLVSAPYVLTGIGCSAGALLVFAWLDAWGYASRTCISFGRNSILLYIAAGFETLLIMQCVPVELPFGYVLLLALSAYIPCHILARALDRKGIYLRI